MDELTTVKKIEAELFTPALQQAAQKAKDAGYSKNEALLAAANAYLNMLVPMTGGNQQALTFLRKQVEFLESQV